MKIKSLLLSGFLLASPVLFAQYTETINSNRPGQSQGAFAVGKNVLQVETGVKLGNDNHDLLGTDTNLWGIDFEVRYGFFKEALEVSLRGSYLSSTEKYFVSGTEYKNTFSNFDKNTLGAKYLVYDPHKKRMLEGPNLYSWKADNTFQWRDLIPAVSVYAGLNLAFGDDNPYLPEGNNKITPQFALITQHNLGRWVYVMNFIADKLSSDFPSYSGIFTLTHSINREISVFGEYQAIKSDYYSDDIARLGAAYLFGNDLQVDMSFLTNFKDTPYRWQVALGVSYRLDMHSTDEYIMEDKKKSKEVEKKEKEVKQNRQDGFENEVVE